MPQNGDAADLQRERRIARHALLVLVILVGSGVDAAGGDERIGSVNGARVGSAEALQRGGEAIVVTGGKRVMADRVERIGIGTIVLQHRRIRRKRRCEVARGQTCARDATRCIQIRWIERDDLLRGDDSVRILPFASKKRKAISCAGRKRGSALIAFRSAASVFASSFAAFAATASANAL